MENEGRNCRCSRRGRICVCVPREHLDPGLIQVMNEARRLRVMEELSSVLERDLIAVDAKWVLFTMAVQSYRYEVLVVPFPPAYKMPTGLNINSLSYVTGTMTELTTCQRRLIQNLLPPEQTELLHWLLVQSDTPQLRQVPRTEHPELWRQLDYKPDPRPHLIFRVAPKGPNVGPVKPLDLANCLFYCGDMEELFAMMSARNYDISRSKLEFYDDLESATNMTEWCPGWGYSICGTLLRCVAVCQLHEHKRLEVRYLLFWSMCYTKQAQAMRRRQWKRIALEQRVNEQYQQQEPANNMPNRGPHLHRWQHFYQWQQQQQQELQQQFQEQQLARNRIQNRQREHVEDILDYGDHQQLRQRPSQSSFFNMIFNRRSALVVLGVLTLASLTLVVARNVRQVNPWRTNWLTRY